MHEVCDALASVCLRREQRTGKLQNANFSVVLHRVTIQGVYIPPTPEELQAAEGFQRTFR